LYEVFRGEVVKVCKIRHLSYQNVADMANLKKCTVAAFMCGARDSDATAKAIAKALDIEL
jgi:transcriptional regulator with XRE-family HTH domain